MRFLSVSCSNNGTDLFVFFWVSAPALHVSLRTYRVVPGHKNWQMETAGWNWAGFFTKDLETRW